MQKTLAIVLTLALAAVPPVGAMTKIAPVKAVKAPVTPPGMMTIGTIHVDNGFQLDADGFLRLSELPQGIAEPSAQVSAVGAQSALVQAMAINSPHVAYVPAVEWDETQGPPRVFEQMRVVLEPGKPMRMQGARGDGGPFPIFPESNTEAQRNTILRVTSERFGWLRRMRPESWETEELDGGLRRLMDGAGRESGDAAAAVPGGERAQRAASPAERGLEAAGRAAGLHAPEQDVPDPQAEARAATLRREQARAQRAFKFWSALLGPVVHLLYRPIVHGRYNVPRHGPALLLPNHVTWLDVFLISFMAGRPVRFLMYKPYYESSWIHWFVKQFRPIPIEPGNRAQVDEALKQAQQALREGDLVAIFPEGKFTYNGNLQRFKRGMESILDGLDVPAIPVHLDGFWGSMFSKRAGKGLWTELTDKIGSSLLVHFGKALYGATVDTARDAVEQLAGMNMRERVLRERRPLGSAFVRASYRFWRRKAVSDSTGKSLTYGKLLTGSLLLGNALKADLAGQNNVGIFLPPTVGGALANVTVAQLGKTSVNLNYTAGRDSVGKAVDTARIETVLTSRKFMDGVKEKTGIDYSGLPVKFIYLEDLAPRIPGWKKTLTYLLLSLLPRWLVERRLFPQAAPFMEDDATLIFTSGSTGSPKGVRLSHLNIQANVKMMEEVFEFKQTDVMLGVLPFFHSFGFTETLWMPLLNGVHAVYHTSPFETDAIDELARQYKPTILLATPSFLLRYRKEVSPEAFARLKLVVAGAERLYVRDAEGFKEKFGAEPLEGYGATETSPVSAVNVEDVYEPAGEAGTSVKLHQVGNKPGSVGHPPPGVAVRVVDPETGGFLPAGQEGVVLIKGPHVMKGYYGDRARTSEVLKNGWYYTGDVGYRDRDGFLFLTGRLSRFSKIGGEMVSHDLVEEKLHEAIGAAERRFAVAGVPDAKMGEKLVVLYEGFDGSVDELLEKVGARLPRIAKPLAVNFHRVDHIPLLGSGKMDLKAVQKLALERDAAGE